MDVLRSLLPPFLRNPTQELKINCLEKSVRESQSFAFIDPKIILGCHGSLQVGMLLFYYSNCFRSKKVVPSLNAKEFYYNQLKEALLLSQSLIILKKSIIPSRTFCTS